MIKEIKKHWKEVLFLILGVPIIFISITYFLFDILPGNKIIEKNNWIGFAGSYLGIIGAVGTVWLQIKNEKEKEQLKKEEKEEEEDYKNLKKELYGVVSFLIVFRESCTDSYLFYFELNEKYNKEKIKQKEILLLKENYKIKENLFLKFLSDIEIENRNRCIELFYSLERISCKYSILYFDNYFEHLKTFYLNISNKTDEILGEYEEIKKDKKNDLDILSNRVFLDLTSLLEEIDQFIKKIGEERNEKN